MYTYMDIRAVGGAGAHSGGLYGDGGEGGVAAQRATSVWVSPAARAL